MTQKTHIDAIREAEATAQEMIAQAQKDADGLAQRAAARRKDVLATTVAQIIG